MKRLRILLLLLLASVMSVTTAFAQSVGTVFTVGNCEYRVSKKDVTSTPKVYEVEVRHVHGSGKIVIPAKVRTPEGMDQEEYNVVGSMAWSSKADDSVTEIEFSEGFKKFSTGSFRNTKLKKIVIPASCEAVENGSFAGCEQMERFEVKTGSANYKSNTDGSLLSLDGTKLVRVPASKTGPYTVPDGVQEIMPTAFSNCKKMTVITIPASVNKVSDLDDFPSFSSSGTHFTVNGGNTTFCDKDGLLCSKDGTKLVHVPYEYDQLGSDKKLTVPASVTEVLKNAAVNCFMKSLDLNKVKTIGKNAFASCGALESVNIGKDVEKIGEGSFSNCVKVKAFNVASENAKYKSDNGIIYTKDLAEQHLLIYPTGKEATEYTVLENTVHIDANAFTDVVYLEKINIAKTVKDIGMAAFKSAKKLKEIKFLPTSQLEEIGENAFQYSKLENITIPASVKKLGDATFADVKTLKKVHFAVGSQLDRLPPFLFQNNESLEEVVFDGENKLTSIGSFVFLNCQKLKMFKMPKGVKTIASGAFKGASGMETIEFETPSSLKSIANGAFADCGIKHINLPESVTFIEALAFDHCTKLTEIMIPKNVQKIDAGAFNFCEGLLEFEVDEANPHFSELDGMLSSKDRKTLKVFPAGKADSKYTLLPYFEKVDEFAFYACSKLSNITFPRTITEIGDRSIALCKNLKSFSFMGKDNVPVLKKDILYESTKPEDITVYVRKAWFEKPENEATIRNYNTMFKEVHPSFVPTTGYDRGIEFFPTSMEYVGVISFNEFNDLLNTDPDTLKPRTSVIILPKAKEKGYTDKFGKEHPEKDYDVSSVLDFAFENEQTAKAITFLADIEYIGLKAFMYNGSSNSIENLYFVGDKPAELGSKIFKSYSVDYPFTETQNIYVKESKVDTYKHKWRTDFFELQITHKIPQKTHKNGGTVCFPFDVKYPQGQGDEDIKPYIPKDYEHAHDIKDPFVRAYSLDDYYVPAFVGVFIRSKNKETVTSYCQMDELQKHVTTTLQTAGAYNPATYRMKGMVQDTIIHNGNEELYAFKKSTGKLVKLKDGARFPYFKAYLRMPPAGSGAKPFSIVFDDEPVVTGIEEINTLPEDNANDAYYNINGTRVVTPKQKGVYIRNGKKVIVE
ncbi:leucine-rich repeat domain-containing protein [Prevotella sp. OH937_COT-195]|uniref:leucine-rich repeat domain-containing protein n=1 Tax=Prevotella sp. OH937_COT-195 TaxID=2491051 RepID=UPI000F64E018|nr:leucine-rich repeat domain-containing protein [Prevotella sp. OH937_COT-195]RRD01935.1 leucine-rich repeat domain-containing protein [Prevotella sp. OH937_COT-195]